MIRVETFDRKASSINLWTRLRWKGWKNAGSGAVRMERLELLAVSKFIGEA